MARLKHIFSEEIFRTETLSPTMSLRWFKKGDSKELQQAWKNIETGEIIWANIDIYRFDATEQ